VGSLLEVGTGFHPELTGRENVFLSAAILGMRRAETLRRFDEIVAFAEIEPFLDTPVKYYSSGMYLRLAFAVAAHLEPEILLVDEILAVGDAPFRRRCLDRIRVLCDSGRTILFVSHNISAVRSYCSRAIWLHSGRVRAIGSATDITEQYLASLPTLLREGGYLEGLVDSQDPNFRFISVDLSQGSPLEGAVLNGKPLEVKIEYRVLRPTSGLRIYLDLATDDESLLARSFHDERATDIIITQPGRYRSRAFLPADILVARRYMLTVQAGIHNVRYCTPDGIRIPLQVQQTSSLGSAYPDTTPVGAMHLPIRWENECLGEIE
jgi:lipopolysaccharide transport system ATP-binding protein